MTARPDRRDAAAGKQGRNSDDSMPPVTPSDTPKEMRTRRKGDGTLAGGVERIGRSSVTSAPRVPLSEVEQMLAASRGGAPTLLMTRIWACTR